MGIVEIVKSKGLDIEKNMEEMILDSYKVRALTPEDKLLLSQRDQNLKILSLNQTQLTSLDNLPQLKSLEVLELQDNKLNGLATIETIASNAPNLKYLYLAGNRFDNVQHFAPIAGLTKLHEIDISMNPLTLKASDEMTCRRYLFSLCSSLQLVNSYNRAGQYIVTEDEGSEDEEEDEEDEGENVKIVPDNSQKEPGTLSENRALLKSFYEKQYNDDEDDDDEDFNPSEYDDEDSEIDEESDNDDTENNEASSDDDNASPQEDSPVKVGQKRPPGGQTDEMNREAKAAKHV